MLLRSFGEVTMDGVHVADVEYSIEEYSTEMTILPVFGQGARKEQRGPSIGNGELRVIGGDALPQRVPLVLELEDGRKISFTVAEMPGSWKGINFQGWID